jgi:hypothetical protein
MKKLFFIAVILLITGFTNTNANQGGFKPYPIPSFKTTLEGDGVFLESRTGNNQLDGKRKLNIRVTSMSMFMGGFAQVYAYDATTQSKVGPFYPESGEIISLLVDWDQWGALVRSPEEVAVDIWFDNLEVVPQPNSK